MEIAIFDKYLEPPPRLYPIAEALQHLGGLALERYSGELPDEMELHRGTARIKPEMTHKPKSNKETILYVLFARSTLVDPAGY